MQGLWLLGVSGRQVSAVQAGLPRYMRFLDNRSLEFPKHRKIKGSWAILPSPQVAALVPPSLTVDTKRLIFTVELPDHKHYGAVCWLFNGLAAGNRITGTIQPGLLGSQAVEQQWRKLNERITLEFSGSIGAQYDQDDGFIADLCDGQAQSQGVQIGWQIQFIDDAPFDDAIFEQKRNSSLPYRLTFSTVEVEGPLAEFYSTRVADDVLGLPRIEGTTTLPNDSVATAIDDFQKSLLKK